MKLIESTPIVLSADNGFKLTQSADVAIAERIITTHVELAVTDSAGNWTEITDDEAEEILRLQREMLAAEL